MHRVTTGRRLMILLAFALIAASCTGSDDGGESSDGADEAMEEEAMTDEDGASAGEETLGVSWAEISDQARDVAAEAHGCLYRYGIVIGLTGQTPPDAPVLDVDDLAQFQALDGYESTTGPEFETLVSRLAIILIDENVDPGAIAQAMNDAGYPASPVHLMVPAVHWGYAPGTLAQQINLAPSEETRLVDSVFDSSPISDPKQVVVLDTGLSDPETLQGSPVSALDPARDSEGMTLAEGGREIDKQLPAGLEGHGEFVSSIIRQQRPNTVVTNVKVEGVTASSFERRWLDPVDRWGAEWPVDPKGNPIDGAFTDDLALAVAVTRLFVEKVTPNVLNISMGTYLCDDGAPPLGIVMAMDLARQLGDGSESPTVVAAVGNHNPSLPDDERTGLPPFLPADLDEIDLSALIDREGDPIFGAPEIIPVGALDPSGADIAEFSNRRDGHSFAIGETLIGRADGQAVVWSGSSFATAVVSADVAHGQVGVSQDVHLWPGQQPTQATKYELSPNVQRVGP